MGPHSLHSHHNCQTSIAGHNEIMLLKNLLGKTYPIVNHLSHTVRTRRFTGSTVAIESLSSEFSVCYQTQRRWKAHIGFWNVAVFWKYSVIIKILQINLFSHRWIQNYFQALCMCLHAMMKENCFKIIAHTPFSISSPICFKVKF